MIKERNVFQSLLIEYEGKPTVKATVDGTHVLTASGKLLPEHKVRKTRRISLPAGAQGNVAQMTADITDISRYQFESVPEAQFSENILYHYYEVTFNKVCKLRCTWMK